jgi:proline dehydrogenase
LLRSYLITTVSSLPILLRPSLAALSFLAHAKSPLFSADTNPLIRMALKKTLYAQFCAGETPGEIRSTVAQLKQMGYAGVILGYAKEVVLEGRDAEALDARPDCVEQERCNAEEIATWKNGNLETVRLADKGDFVALKFSGAGRQALQQLLKGNICGPELEDATHTICRLAKERGVKLLFDAEQNAVQAAIDRWTMHFMRFYNQSRRGGALVYGTYQAYRKDTPAKLVKHMEEAKSRGFTLGVKLVRGAYLGSDPRHLMWATIEETHRCYDGIAEAVIRRKWNDVLRGEGEMAAADLVLASHNRQSVKRARAIRDQQAGEGESRIEMVYGQLMGMADNVSCELVQEAQESREVAKTKEVDVPQAFKYLVWGTVGQCSKYLLRRAQENRDAVTRTAEGRRALGRELARRMGFVR